LDAYYTGTDIKVSYLYNTDMATFYYSEPMCEECILGWARCHHRYIVLRLSVMARRIQKKWRQFYWSPPNGKGYLKAKGDYEKDVKELYLTIKLS